MHSNAPLDIQHFIKLITDIELDKKSIRRWYNTVMDNAPSGTVHSVQQTDPNGNPKIVGLVHREKEGKHQYIIPLTRHLRDDEVSKIVEQWAVLGPKFEYQVEPSADDEVKSLPVGNVEMEQDAYDNLCWQLAKHMHNKWVEEKARDGWNYGPKFDRENKKHPMLLNWDRLPEAWQEIDYDLPAIVARVFSEQGYEIKPKD